ncbi:hypothetical protein H257_12554 [Aphanomyces astaci]|uniref:BZIP domain-containing protein n=1 Tax=Aphanomyces astaci TaxID=112090 RepID=W4G042_APHAT|nr:hypothetical protein H257_12554 [Aphanomyces astaci]ETV72424.1 hypothetical protein H257_12554 [Aphanomyces astaci]|eukprot:XP_009838106.1 hypothetical protein H257_12554 [Aphanomyces astaci]
MAAELDHVASVDELNLLPEDEDILSYFCAAETDVPLLRDVVSKRATPRAGGVESTHDLSVAGNKRSIETASNASSELDGPESPTGGDNEQGTDEGRRRKRLERNRESARQSRRRKKQYLELLEGKVAQLTDEIDEAREEHLDSADSTINALKNQLVTSLNKLLDNHPPSAPLPSPLEDELREGVYSIQTRFGPNAKERQAVVNYHFTQLDSLLLPPYTRFLLWMSIQDEVFYTKTSAPPTPGGSKSTKPKESDRKDSVANKDGLWAALSTELGLTYEQEEKIKGHYRASDSKTAKLERRKIAMAVTYLHQLKANMLERAHAVQTYADTMQGILTPDQTIRFQQWAMQHRAGHADVLKERGLQFAPSSAMDPSAKISTILHKQDRDLTVEDVTSLLATLSKKPSASEEGAASVPSTSDSTR